MENSISGATSLSVCRFIFNIRGISEIPTQYIIFPIRKPFVYYAILTVFYLYLVSSFELDKLIKRFLIFINIVQKSILYKVNCLSKTFLNG